MTPPIPAATLILFRPAAAGPPVLLMIERATGMAFAAGARVFPGGRVDPGDQALAARYPDIDAAAARIAAIRETIEETGIAVGLSPAPSAPMVETIRAGLAAGRDFGALLDAADLALDLRALTPFARWCPDAPVTRAFDARFYIAEAPQHAAATPDNTETIALEWTTAAAALAAADSGQTRIIYPTRRNLERLALFAGFDEAVANATAHPVQTITPWIDGDFLRIPEGLGYPATSEPLKDVERG